MMWTFPAEIAVSAESAAIAGQLLLDAEIRFGRSCSLTAAENLDVKDCPEIPRFGGNQNVRFAARICIRDLTNLILKQERLNVLRSQLSGMQEQHLLQGLQVLLLLVQLLLQLLQLLS